MTTNNLFEIIQHYQRSIERNQEDENRLLHCVNKLYNLPVKVEHLQETGIGKTVNSLRKFNGEIGIAAKTLVTKWKAMVAAAEEDEPMDTNNEEEVRNARNADRSSPDEDQCDLNQNTAPSETNEKTRNSSSRDKESSQRKHSKERENKDKHKSHHSKSSSTTKSSSEHETSKLKTNSNHDNHHHHRSSHSQSVRQRDDKEKPLNKSSSCEKAEKKDEEHKRSKEHSGNSKHHNDDRNNSSKRNHDRSEDQQHSKLKDKERSESKSEHEHRDSRDNKEKHEHKENRADRQKHEHKEKSDLKDKQRDRHGNNENKSEKHRKSSKDKEHGDRNKTKEDKSEKQSKSDKADKPHKSSSKSSSAHSASDTKSTSTKSSDVKHSPSSLGSTYSTDSSAKKRHRDSDELNVKSKAAKTSSRSVSNGNHGGNEDDCDNNEEEIDVYENGIDSSMGANFADVLGMLNKTKGTKKPYKIKVPKGSITHWDEGMPSTSKSSNRNGIISNNSYTNSQHLNLEYKPELLTSTAKLEPLDPSIALELPTISTNYKPMPLNQTVMDVVFNTSNSSSSIHRPVRTLTDDEALSHGISSKTMRTKIYSGGKPGQILQVPTLFDLCIRILQKNIDALEYTGGVPFEVLRPVLERATPQQLLIFEDFNPYLMEDSDILWQQHVQRNYRAQKRQEMETWREMFLRCQEDQDRKLSILAESIKQSQKIIAAPVRKTQLAFVDSMVKPPRNVQRKQEQYGTKSKLIATPAARVAALSNVTPNAAKPGDTRLRVLAATRDTAQVATVAPRNKKAPLMAKTLMFMRGRHKR